MGIGSTITGALYATNGGLNLTNVVVNNCTTSSCFVGACCLPITQTCQILNQTACSVAGGSFFVDQVCNSTLCQLPIIISQLCFINNGTSCTSYFSYNSTNTIPITIPNGKNNYITFNSTVINTFNQPTTFYPGFNNQVFNLTSSGCLQYNWTVNSAA